MKFGCCANMIVKSLDVSYLEAIEMIANNGYDYVELPISTLVDMDEIDYTIIKSKLKSLDLPCPTCNNFFPEYIKLTGPDVSYEKVKDYAKKAISIASDIGARRIVLGSSGAKNYPLGYKKEEALKQLKTISIILNEIAKKHQIIIVFENLNAIESNLLNTVSESLDFAKNLNLSNMKVLVDYYHMMVEKESMEIIKKASGYIGHVHIARLLERTFPIDIQGRDYDDFIKALKSISYDDYISFECYTHDFQSDSKIALGFMKEKFVKI